ncbi:MAG: hypothetical protein ACRC5S_10580 [Cetobacterium sp.]
MFKNFKRYIPEKAEERILYLKSECGKDWYECQKEYEENTLKIMVDSQGRIISVSKDISMLFPEDCSVYEVKNLNISEVYEKELYYFNDSIVENNRRNRNIFIENKIITLESEKEKARNFRKNLFETLDILEVKAINKRIELTESEIEELNIWYSKWLNIPNEYVDINIPIETLYPVTPQKIEYLKK